MSNFQLPPPPFGIKITNQPGPAESVLAVAAENRCYKRVENVAVFECACLRCGRVWHTLQQVKPKSCPNKSCHSNYWDRPRSETPRLPKGSKAEKVKDDATKGIKMPGGKNASRKLQEGGPAEYPVTRDGEISEEEVDVLATVGESSDSRAGYTGRTESEIAAELQGEASLSVGAIASSELQREDNPGVQVGQSDDDGGRQNDHDTDSAQGEDLTGADELIKGIM